MFRKQVNEKLSVHKTLIRTLLTIIRRIILLSERLIARLLLHLIKILLSLSINIFNGCAHHHEVITYGADRSLLHANKCDCILRIIRQNTVWYHKL